MSYIALDPDPASLVESMRDIGYSMETAIADLIDNSIAAKATEVDIHYSWNKGDPWLAIADNGHGMSGDELTSAMRLGSQNPKLERDISDLGRFGLGLKTASFSQCRKLTVISKLEGIESGREWDLDSLSEPAANGRWLLHVLSQSDIQDVSEFTKLDRNHGTVVLWRKMDRLDNDDGPAVSEQKLDGLIDCTKRHMELVYHRFLIGVNSLTITINGYKLSGLDPFNPTHPATQNLPEETVVVNGATISIQPFILPHHSKVSKSDYEKHEGESGYLRNQGFYVYRNRRLIIHGTWFRLARQEELTKLARVQIDIPNTLDHLWSIDVKKSRATPPEFIRGRLRNIIDRIRGTGSNVYRRRGQRLSSANSEPLWVRKAADGKIKYEVSRTHPIVKSLEYSVDDEAKQLLRDLIGAIESRFPTDAFFNDAAGKPEGLDQSGIEQDSLKRLTMAYVKNLKGAGMPDAKIPAMILDADPFSKEPDSVKQLLKEEGFEV